MPRKKLGPKTSPGRRPGRGLNPKRKKDDKDPRFGLEFKEGTPPLGTSNQILPIKYRSIKSFIFALYKLLL